MAASKDKKVMDVAKPEEAKVNIGSKPMIVGHKSMASDPMVRENESEQQGPQDPDKAIESADKEEKPVEEKLAPPSARQKTIAPITIGDSKSDSKESADDAKSEPEEVGEPTETVDEKAASNEPQAEEPEEVKEPEPAEEKPAAPEPEPEPEKTDDAAKDEPEGDLKDGDSKKDDKKIDPEAEAMEREGKVRNIISSKKYNVSIKQARGSSKGRLWTLVVLMIIGLAGLFVAIDTGNIDLGFKLPFSVFGSNEEKVGTQQPVVNESQDTEMAVPAPDATTDTEEVVVLPTDGPTEYSLSTPDNWTYARTVQAQADSNQELFTDTFTLPSGTKLVINEDMGGRGGYCEPITGDTPHAAGNACPTYELLTKQELDLEAATQAKLTEGTSIFLTEYRYTSDDGVSTYGVCLQSFDAQFDIAVNDPQMGLYDKNCYSRFSVNGNYLIITIEGVDASTNAFFTDLDIKTIETVLLTFELPAN